MTTKRKDAKPENSDGYKLQLTIPVDGAAGDGTAQNKAEVKVKFGSALQKCEPITFEISKGNAKFSNGKKIIGDDGSQTTNVIGILDEFFSDDTAETGEMIAYRTNNPDDKSNTALFTFAKDPHNYKLSLTRTKSNACADGKSPDAARLNARIDDVAADGIPITFTLDGNDEAFFLPLDSNSPRVKHGTTSNGGIVDVSFASGKAGEVILNAYLSYSQNIHAEPVSFVMLPQGKFAIKVASGSYNGALLRPIYVPNYKTYPLDVNGGPGEPWFTIESSGNDKILIKASNGNYCYCTTVSSVAADVTPNSLSSQRGRCEFVVEALDGTPGLVRIKSPSYGYWSALNIPIELVGTPFQECDLAFASSNSR